MLKKEEIKMILLKLAIPVTFVVAFVVFGLWELVVMSVFFLFLSKLGI